ncbi:MAG: creatininase family protein, partial [Candidatus Marinimicrobia bacterium]|nr:creatininase family protein [Candidatus Neomarinimicrobiota bacterium]
MTQLGIITALLLSALAGQKSPSTREMNLIGWQEFQSWVPGKIETVLLPVGTLEP